GYGGSCFPKDTRALARLAEEMGYDFKLIKTVIEVNDRQRELMVDKIERITGGVAGKQVAVLGLTFKPNTDDVREAPALYITQRLVERGAKVRAYDPAGMKNAAKVLTGVEYAENLYQAAKGADALVIMTEWNQFRNLDWKRIKQVMNDQVVVDLKNIYEPARMKELGFVYTSVGR
ncbi:MAG: UDP binding domain-containing protein, partial [Thermodesulfobacteriota bacterium]